MAIDKVIETDLFEIRLSAIGKNRETEGCVRDIYFVMDGDLKQD